MAEKETRHQAYLTVYFCGSENCPPRHAYGPAVRPHYLLHVILKGRGIYQYKGQTYALSAGDAFLIPPAEVTYYQADEREPWSYAWVGFDGKAVPEILARTVFSEAFVFRKETPDSIAPLTDQMKKLCETFFQSPEDQLSAAGDLLLLFSFMKKKAPETSQEPTQIYLQKAKEYLENKGVTLHSAFLLGGGAKSRLWAQILSDCLGIELILTEQNDSSFGSAMLAGIAAGFFRDEQDALSRCSHITGRITPRRENRAAYDRLFEKYKRIQKMLTTVYHA